MHDPDAPLIKRNTYGYVHWVRDDLLAETTSLAEGTDAGTCGTHDFGNENYGGPMPPEGHGTRRYCFWSSRSARTWSSRPG